MQPAEMPVLYTCAGSRGLRGTWAAMEAGVEIDLHMLPFPPRFLAPEYLEQNPLGTVPLLVHGDNRMTESCAIAHYLAVIGKEPSLVVQPDEADYCAYLDFTYHADATLTFPQTVFLRFARFEKDKGLEEAGHAYARWFGKRLLKAEQQLETREFLCGGRFTVADICVAYALFLARRIGLGEYISEPLAAYLDRLTGRDGFQKAIEAEQREAEAAGIAAAV